MKTTRMDTTPIKPTLQAMEVGQRTDFPRNRRKSVRTTASDLKTDEDKILELGSTEITFMLNAKNNKQWEELKQSEKLNQSQRNGSAKTRQNPT